MEDINKFVGKQIRQYRKANKMTLQQLADAIYKSRATVSKYENGEITIDISTLYEISKVLDVHINELTSYHEVKTQDNLMNYQGGSPFFDAHRLYFYFYDGRYKRLKDGVIDISREKDENGMYNASLSINSFNSFNIV